MASKYIKKYTIPEGFEVILIEFTKEILRNQPWDIIDFGVNYFHCLQEGLLLDYPNRGQNLPCDFRPSVPRLPKIENKLPLSPQEQTRMQEDREQRQREEDINRKENELNQPKNKAIINEEIEDNPEEPETYPENKRESEILVQEEKDPEDEKQILGEEQKTEEINTNVWQNEPQITEQNDDADKESYPMRTTGTVPNETAPAVTLPSWEETWYENCIDFEEKEMELSKLKAINSDEVDNYIKTVFTPNKPVNDVLVLLQKGITTYYKVHASDDESAFTAIKSEIETATQSLIAQNLIVLPEDNYDIKEYIKIYKNLEYYNRIFVAYHCIFTNLLVQNNPALDEFAYFTFNSKLKDIITTSKPMNIIHKCPFIKKYFINNIALIQPDIYSLVLNRSRYDEDTFMRHFTSFTVRKRELCINFWKFYHLETKDRNILKEFDVAEKGIFISSLDQIYEKLLRWEGDNFNANELQNISDKIQRNYQKIWMFITRIANTPIELVHTSFDEFMMYTSIERKVLLKYISLQPDFAELFEKFSSIAISDEDCDFMHLMKNLYSDLASAKEIQDRLLCIYRSKEYKIPERINTYLQKCWVKTKELNEEELIEEFKGFDTIAEGGIYFYLSINEDSKTGHFLEKLKFEKSKREWKIFEQRVTGLRESFTTDSDEFISIIKEFEIWMTTIPKDLQQYFVQENKDHYFDLWDDSKKSVAYMIACWLAEIHENSPWEEVREKYKGQFEGGIQRSENAYYGDAQADEGQGEPEEQPEENEYQGEQEEADDAEEMNNGVVGDDAEEA